MNLQEIDDEMAENHFYQLRDLPDLIGERSFEDILLAVSWDRFPVEFDGPRFAELVDLRASYRRRVKEAFRVAPPKVGGEA